MKTIYILGVLLMLACSSKIALIPKYSVNEKILYRFMPVTIIEVQKTRKNIIYKIAFRDSDNSIYMDYINEKDLY